MSGGEPQPRPLSVDASYGLSAEPAHRPPWAAVEAQLREARNYWLCTTRPDGRPHAVPVWGVWLDGGLYFGTARDSVKGRNLEASRLATVHLESGDEVVTLDGAVTDADATALAAVIPAYLAKYEIEIDPAEAGSWYLCFRPRSGLSWSESDFVETATGWTFPAGDSSGEGAGR